MLRCSPCLGNVILSQIDEVLKSNISHIAKVVLSDVQWIQASLPMNARGLGIRRAASLALPAYPASQQDKSRFLAVTSSHSSDWLHALPIASCGLR